MKRPDQVEVKVSLPPVGVSGVWKAGKVERSAAWELYVELVTRVATVELGPTEGLLREALTSLHQLFPITREILRRYGPAVAPKKKGADVSFGGLAVNVLNRGVRPLLATWHPLLADHEARRPPNVSSLEHERHWDREVELRDELDKTRGLLIEFARSLEEVSGVTSLLPSTSNQNT